jgi:F0F1-type ATP synthase assembly protein I
MQWVSTITTIGLMMVLPAALGYWLDTLWGTGPWLLVAGALLGFVLGLWELRKLAKIGPGGRGSRPSPPRRADKP